MMASTWLVLDFLFFYSRFTSQVVFSLFCLTCLTHLVCLYIIRAPLGSARLESVSSQLAGLVL